MRAGEYAVGRKIGLERVNIFTERSAYIAVGVYREWSSDSTSSTLCEVVSKGKSAG
jgi:hypothetical protein